MIPAIVIGWCVFTNRIVVDRLETLAAQVQSVGLTAGQYRRRMRQE